MSTNTILVINPGSTSTKIAVFKENVLFWEKSLSHDTAELNKFPTIFKQFDFRKQTILDSLVEAGIDLKEINAVAGRGGLLKSVPGGTYAVNELMLKDLEEAERGEHASNLGAAIASDIARSLNIPAYIVDPVVVDELDPIARITGLEGHDRLSIFHALNQKAVARRSAKTLGIKYEQGNFIVAHLGGGISVGAHNKGRVVDVNNALYGEGPFSPERTGGLPTNVLLNLCYKEKLTEKEVKKKLAGKGGLVSYFNTNDARLVCQMIEDGDEKAALVYEAMAYQVAKEIASCAAVLKGNVDAIAITGGMARDEDFIGWIQDRVSFIGKIVVVPGEFELEALAEGVLRVITGEETAREYI